MASSSNSLPSSTTAVAITKAVQTATILVAGTAAGGATGLSLFVVPRILESPTPLMLQQFQRMVRAGKRTFLTADLIASFGFLWLAFFRRSSRGPAAAAAAAMSPKAASVCYGLASLLSAGIVPYTVLFVLPTNRMLLRRAELTRGMAITDEVVEPADEREGSKFLVDRWGVLNLARPAMVGAATLLGLCASLW